MPDFWPESLVHELANQRCVIFLGSGASRSSVAASGERLDDWKGLLTSFRSGLHDDVKPVLDRTMEANRYLDAAQLIVDEILPADFDTTLRRKINVPGLTASELHIAVLEIDQPVVMTTNYDKLYELYWHSLAAASDPPPAPYAVCRYYEDDAVNHLRSDRRLIMKLHGCVDHTDKVVMSRSQYFHAKRDYPKFYRVVDALFLTRTLLFVGCGFNGDPDIELILEDAAIVAPSAYPHYALVQHGRHPSEKRSIRETFNIELLEYGDDHAEAIVLMQLLRDLVLAKRAALV